MGKIRVPSPSWASTPSVPAQNTHAEKPKPREPHASPRHARRDHRLGKAKYAVKEAAKRSHKTRKTKKPAAPCIVYVGNVGPEVDESALLKHFSCCGKIYSVRIHCCGGVAMTVKPPPATYHENMRVRQYAIITFESELGRQRACKLESILAGRQLTVSMLVSDLPEVREKIEKRLEDYKSRMEPADVQRAQQSALRSLKLEPTMIIDGGGGGGEQEVHKQNMIWGYSLAATIV